MGATEHVEHKEIIQAIPIEIREINSHGKHARVSQRRFRNRSKPPLPVIDPDAIFGGEIIADIYIRRAFAIDIAPFPALSPAEVSLNPALPSLRKTRVPPPMVLTIKSRSPSPSMSANAAPVASRPGQATPALAVISSNFQWPRLRYRTLSLSSPQK